MRIERHVFASNASRYDTAWATFGASPGVDAALATRLEEVVPWGSRMARLPDPPRLSGSPDDVAAPGNRDRLGQALLPVEDGLWAFSVWGAFGPEPDGGEWRVLTHTLLLDAPTFRALGGHPGGLLAPDGRPAGWLAELAGERRFEARESLDPLVVEDGPGARARFEDALRHDLARWRRMALERRGGDEERLASDLGATLEALAEAVAGARAGGDVRHVAMPVAPDGPHGALLRLAWHGLPVGDRLAVPWVSEQRRTGSPRGVLLGLPTDEWEGRVPEAARLLPDEAGGAPTPSEGRAHWASLVARGETDALEALAGRIQARRWSVVVRDDLSAAGEAERWRARWLLDGPSVEAALELAEVEARRPAGGRWRAVGRVLGEALAAARRAGPDAPVADRSLEPAVEGALALGGDRSVALLRGAVRRLRADPDTAALAGRLRIAAADHPGAPPEVRAELRRLVDREADAVRALIRSDAGGLLLAALRVAGADGDRVAEGLARLAAPAVRWSDGTTAELDGRLPGAAADAILPGLLAAVAEAGGDVAAAVAAAAPLLGRSGAEAVAGGLAHADDPDAWRALAAHAPARVLAPVSVLAPLVAGLGAGRLPFGLTADPDAGALARRVVDEGGLHAPGPPRADALLRLVWAEGTGATVEGWSTRPERAPLLAALLALPAPPPLDGLLRDALERAAAAAGPGPLEPWLADLEAGAPATWEAVWGGRSTGPRVFVAAGGGAS